MLVMGGGRVAPNPSNEVDVYDPGTNSWSLGMPFTTARHNFPTDTDGSNHIWLAGGYDSTAVPVSSMEIFCNATSINLVSAASRLTQGSAGDFDIDMPLTGTSGVEDRDAAGSFLAVFTFDAAVTSGNATVVGGTATAGTPTFSGNEMRVPLTGVTDVQTVTVEISGVNGGGATADVAFGFLIGGVNGDRTVRNTDGYVIKADKSQPVTGSNFRDDINLSGRVDRPDLNSVKANRGHSLP